MPRTKVSSMLPCDIFIHQGAMLCFGLSIALRTHSSSVSVVIPKFFLETEPPVLCIYPVHFHPGSSTSGQELCSTSSSSPALPPCLGTAAPQTSRSGAQPGPRCPRCSLAATCCYRLVSTGAQRQEGEEDKEPDAASRDKERRLARHLQPRGRPA